MKLFLILLAVFLLVLLLVTLSQPVQYEVPEEDEVEPSAFAVAYSRHFDRE